QYTLGIELPELVANNLSGPSLPLHIGFNPMNTQDSGFGMGWTLNLTQYDPGTNLLHLHTGESFKVTGSDASDGTGKVFKERKLRSFHFHDHGAGYRVEHKAGLVELLELKGPSDNLIAVPTRVEAPSGHGITLSYNIFQKAPCLVGIEDDTGLKLLAITYTDDLITVDLHPESGPGFTPLARYTLEYDRRFSPAVRLPHTIVLPSDDKASWGLDYDKVREVVCLTKVRSPVGGVETIEYNDDGHLFPGDVRDALPRVTKHTIKPGAEQPDMVTTYAYTSNNFLGRGSGITWRDNGEDNLYEFTGTDFSYGSTATYLADATPLRTITRSFNRFHLLTRQVTEQVHEVYDEGATQPRRETCLHELETVYHETNEEFKLQPNYFQMPKHQLKRWKIKEDVSRLREEVLITYYDEHGNLALESKAAAPVYKGDAIDEDATLATTVHTRHTYYPSTHNDADCPPDPQLFTRSRKTSTVYPATHGEGQAATLETRFRYKYLRALQGATVGKGWLEAHEEDLLPLAGGDDRQRQYTRREYQDVPGDALQHGRMTLQTKIMNGHQTKSEYAFTKRADLGDAVLNEVRTVTGFNHGEDLGNGAVRHVQKVNTLHHNVLINQPLLNFDDNEVEIAYEYDALRRVTKETVSPGGDFEAEREYTYTLVSQTGGEATQTSKDVNGVITRTVVDGLNRAVAQSRQDADNADEKQRAAWRPTYAAQYDELGNLIAETDFDWLDYPGQAPRELALTREMLFDGWGQQYCEIAVDKVRHYKRHDPIGTSILQGPTQTQWRESADGQQASGKTITWMTLFEEPTRVERFDANGESYSINLTLYDGLQRKAREVNARGEEKRFAYDVFDRLVDETLATDDVVHRDYAEHSSEDLPILISVNGVVLGEQRFDGLDRMIESKTGGRVRKFDFKPGQMKPSTVLTPSDQLIEYLYKPELTEEPQMRQIVEKGIKADYRHDSRNARLVHCEEQGLALAREYFTHGKVKSETREYQGESHTMHYQTSLLGRELGYIDVLGGQQSYEYDTEGRLRQTTLGTTVATFDYDDLGRMYKTTTQEGDHYLETVLAFDEFDREVERTFNMGGTLQSLTQGYDVENAIVWKELRESAGLLRRETYLYDLRGRMYKYNCEGSLCPEDPYGKVINEQVFRFDALDNIIRVNTAFAGGPNVARYFFDEQDPAQLKSIENSHPDYPPLIELKYDPDGNLTLDDAGRTLAYDGLGRLISVELPAPIGEAYDEHGNRVWDEGRRRLTADQQGNVIRVDVPAATHPASDVEPMLGPNGEALSAVREAGGRLLWCTTLHDAETAKYGYDPLDRLTSQQY
ncbi:sugar-binding protein, partial [Pseudomonas sp. BN607]|uniref:sugar-binding protein n=1 Tax=Pseudomonas sp. BN607 TaxID=2567895 RepID=UPI002453A943